MTVKAPKGQQPILSEKMAIFLTDCMIWGAIRFTGVSWKLTESGVKASSCGVVALHANE